MQSDEPNALVEKAVMTMNTIMVLDMFLLHSILVGVSTLDSEVCLLFFVVYDFEPEDKETESKDENSLEYLHVTQNKSGGRPRGSRNKKPRQEARLPQTLNFFVCLYFSVHFLVGALYYFIPVRFIEDFDT